jgi:hypothetical protein
MIASGIMTVAGKFGSDGGCCRHVDLPVENDDHRIPAALRTFGKRRWEHDADAPHLLENRRTDGESLRSGPPRAEYVQRGIGDEHWSLLRSDARCRDRED